MIEINECSENRDNCGQLCLNTPGSYSCDCRTGYRLHSDGATCNGILSPALSVTHYCLRSIYYYIQISMNVLKIQMVVYRYVRILLEATLAPVALAIA